MLDRAEDGKIVLRSLARWEYPELQGVKQPRPTLTDLKAIGADMILVTRYWRKGDMERCKLCRNCFGNRAKHSSLIAHCIVPIEIGEFLGTSQVKKAAALVGLKS